MSCTVTYIDRLTKSPKIREELREIHSNTWKTLKESRLFNKYNELYYLPSTPQKYMQAKGFIETLNKEFGFPVVGTAFTKEKQKEYVFVNVKNYLPQLTNQDNIQQGTFFSIAEGEYNQVIRNNATNEIEKVLAPNGKESILYKSIIALEPDKEKALRLWAQVYTPSFKQWFGDWETDKEKSSKVVDKNGEPLIVYHATNKDFNEFKPSERGIFGAGVYFTPNKEEASWYADALHERTSVNDIGRVVASFLSIKNPDTKPSLDELFENNRKEGTDGVISIGEHVAFSPNQIKSVFNQGVFSKESDNIYLQRQEKLQNKLASPETLKKVYEFLKRIGVNVEKVKEIIIADGVKAYGVANLLYGLIEVVEGREAATLPEEAVHFAVEILELTNPTLFNEMLSKIGNYAVYQQVLQSYGKIYTKEGKPDIRKIKKEAIARVIVDYIVGKGDVQDTIETGENVSLLEKWWQKVLNWFKEIFQKPNFDPFEEVRQQILGEKEFVGTADILERSEKFYNLAEPELYTKLKESNNTIVKTNEGKFEINGQPIKKVVNYKITKEPDEIDVKDSINGHADINNILERYIDENGLLREKVLDSNYISQLNPKSQFAYNQLFANIGTRLQEYEEGTRFLYNTNVYDSFNVKTANVDFIAILPTGEVDILTWEFLNGKKTSKLDIPFYDRERVQTYIGDIKKLMKDAYGIKTFRRTRGIPIVTYVKRGKGKTPTSIKIGSSNVMTETQDFLLPISEREERTGNDKVDATIDRLNALYDKIKAATVSEGRRDIKKDQLNSLIKAIRDLQLKQSVTKLLSYIDVLDRETDILIDRFEVNFANIDAKIPDRITINNFFHQVLDLQSKYDPFENINNNLKDVADTQELKDKLYNTQGRTKDYIDKLEDLLKRAAQKFIAERYDVLALLEPEKDYSGIGSYLRPISQGGTYASTALYKMSEPIINRIEVERRQELNEYTQLVNNYKKWAESKGLSAKDMFNLIFKKDKDGKYINQRVDTIDKEFFIKFYEARLNKNGDWIKDNIDVTEYLKWVKEAKAVAIAGARQITRDSDPELDQQLLEERLKEIERTYDVSNSKAPGWFLHKAKTFPKEKWFSKEYQEIRKEKPVLDFFEYIKNKVSRAVSFGVIDPEISHSFLPYLRKHGIIEKMVFGGQYKLLQGLIDGITINEDDQGYGYRDPVDGKLKYDIPFRFTTDFSRDSPEDISNNLFKTILQFSEEIINYEGFSEIKSSVEALLAVEKIKDSFQTDERGKIVGKKQSNEANYNFLRDHVLDRIYGIKYDTNQLDATLGKLGEGWDKNFSKINEFLGLKLLPENISGRSVSGLKLINTFNQYFQSKVLTLNFGIPISNLVGGKLQGLINSGTYGRKRDLLRAEAIFTSGMTASSDGKKIMALINTLYPFTEDRDRDRYIKITASKVADTELVRDVLMAPYKYGSRAVEFPNIIMMLENAVVIDGKVQNVYKYLRSKYEGRYKITPDERRKLEDKIDKEAIELKKEKGLVALSKVEKGKLVLPDGMKITDESLLNYRSVITNISRQALGSANPNDRNRAQRNIIFKSFLLFKNWMAPLADKRIGNLRKAEGTDMWEWGRTRMAVKVASQGLHKALPRLRNILIANEKGIDYMRQMLEAKKTEYRIKEGKELLITEDEFIDLMRQNVKDAIADVMFFTLLLIMITAASQSFDDDEDKKGYERFTLRMLNKIYEEMSFYYSPTSLTSIANGSVFPAIGSLNDIAKVVNNVTKQLYGFTIEDGEMMESAHPAKYIGKMHPLTNNLMYYIAIGSEDFAKENGIKITEQARAKN